MHVRDTNRPPNRGWSQLQSASLTLEEHTSSRGFTEYMAQMKAYERSLQPSMVGLVERPITVLSESAICLKGYYYLWALILAISSNVKNLI